MDLGWATVRGRARWATVLGIVAALALIGGSLIALNRSVLSFNGWSSGPEPPVVQQELPAEPRTAVGSGSLSGTPTPGIPGVTGTPLITVQEKAAEAGFLYGVDTHGPGFDSDVTLSDCTVQITELGGQLGAATSGWQQNFHDDVCNVGGTSGES